MDIGKLSAMLTANAAPFLGALSQTSTAVTGWGKGLVSAVSNAASQVASIMGTIGKSLGMAGLIGGLAGGLSVGGMFAGLAAGADNLLRVDIQAKQLGTDVHGLRSALHLAGPAAQEMTQALGVMNGKLLAVQMGSDLARKELAGLASLSGTTADALQAGGWAAIVDAIADIRDPAQRAGMAFRFMGDQAGALLGQLQKGGAVAAKDFVGRMGLGANAGDLESVRQVAKTVSEIKAIGAGAFNQIMLGLAPIVSEISKLFADVRVDLTWIKPTLINIAESVALFGAFLVEASGNSKLLNQAMDYAWQQMTRGFLNFKAVVLEGLAEIADSTHKNLFGDKKVMGLDDVILGTGPGKLGGGGEELKKAAQEAREAAKVIGGQMGPAFNEIMGGVKGSAAGKSVTDFFARVRAEANKTGTAIQDAMGAKAAQKLAQAYQQIAEATASPAAKFREQLLQIEQMQKAGLFAGDPSQKGMAGFQAFQALSSATGMGGLPAAPGAAEARSREAYSAVAAFDREGKRGTVQEQMKAMLEAANRQRELQVEIGKETLTVLKDIREAEVELEV